LFEDGLRANGREAALPWARRLALTQAKTLAIRASVPLNLQLLAERLAVLGLAPKS